MLCSVSQLPHIDKSHWKWTKDFNSSLTKKLASTAYQVPEVTSILEESGKPHRFTCETNSIETNCYLPLLLFKERKQAASLMKMSSFVQEKTIVILFINEEWIIGQIELSE